MTERYKNRYLATICEYIFLTSRHNDLTSQHNALTNRHNDLQHKDLTRRHNYLKVMSEICHHMLDNISLRRILAQLMPYIYQQTYLTPHIISDKLT